MASASQPMAPAPTHTASAAQPMAPASPQPVQVHSHHIDWTSKIAEVMREQFGLRPKQQSVMYMTLYPPAYDQLASD